MCSKYQKTPENIQSGGGFKSIPIFFRINSDRDRETVELLSMFPCFLRGNIIKIELEIIAIERSIDFNEIEKIFCNHKLIFSSPLAYVPLYIAHL